MAMLISTAAILLFMLIYYRFAGVVADIAVLLNVLITVALMIVIKAAFTLPGLAGLVLTVGMAVDANVLIYERIREETCARCNAADGHSQWLCPSHGHDYRLQRDDPDHGHRAVRDRHRPGQRLRGDLDPGPAGEHVHGHLSCRG